MIELTPELEAKLRANNSFTKKTVENPAEAAELEKRFKERIEEEKRLEHEKWLNYWKDVYDYWLKVNLWEINEAACLLCGLNPDGLHNSNYPSGGYFFACWHDEKRRAGDSDFKKRFKEMNRLILDGIEARELIKDTTTYKLHKLTVLKWAMAKIGSDNLPKPLVDWYEQQPEQPTQQAASNQPPEVKPIDDLTESERSKLLKMVLGMALVAYGYNPSAQRNEATGQAKGSICLDLDTKGLHVDVKEIRRFINEAAERFLEQPNEP